MSFKLHNWTLVLLCTLFSLKAHTYILNTEINTGLSFNRYKSLYAHNSYQIEGSGSAFNAHFSYETGLFLVQADFQKGASSSEDNGQDQVVENWIWFNYSLKAGVSLWKGSFAGDVLPFVELRYNYYTLTGGFESSFDPSYYEFFAGIYYEKSLFHPKLLFKVEAALSLAGDFFIKNRSLIGEIFAYQGGARVIYQASESLRAHLSYEMNHLYYELINSDYFKIENHYYTAGVQFSFN